MEISAGFNTSPADLQYWAVDEVMMSWVFNEEILDDERPLKQLRRAEINSSLGERVLAERKRRQKMSQRFTALSALLAPPSKKRDKACILEEAIKHITQLQKRVDTLEKKKKTATATATATASIITSASNQSLLSINNTHSSLLPLIEAKAINSEVLITIHYDHETIMSKGVLLQNIVGVVETKLHLSLVSCSVLHFGHSHLNITIIAQMEEEYYGMISINEVVNNLHAALQIYQHQQIKMHACHATY